MVGREKKLKLYKGFIVTNTVKIRLDPRHVESFACLFESERILIICDSRSTGL